MDKVVKLFRKSDPHASYTVIYYDGVVRTFIDTILLTNRYPSAGNNSLQRLVHHNTNVNIVKYTRHLCPIP